MKKQILVFISLFLVNIALFAQVAEAPLGDGTLENPYQIATLNNLYWITKNYSALSKFFIQTNDIDATSTSSWNSGRGFYPIGYFSQYSIHSFTGVYNGGGYTIDKLTINNTSRDFMGLFAQLSGASISNLSVTNVVINGFTTVGIIAGQTYSSSTIENCFTSGSVTGTQTIGGLVGKSGYSSIISKCSSSATVNTSGVYAMIGGLIGQNSSSTIQFSYFRGIVNGYSECGGIVGRNYEGNVENCYSTGIVSGSDKIGGVTGFNWGGTVNNSFWDTQTSGRATSDGGTGKTTIEMKNIVTFTDETTVGLTTAWDFETNPNDDVGNNNYWDIDQSGIINNGYPFLSWQNGVAISLPVELTTFTATLTSSATVMLNWQTATEVNNYGFSVERKSEVENREWQEVGFVDGHGNSNSPKEYSFIDTSPLSGAVSYRLKQVDIDGTFEYSDVVTVELDSPKQFKFSQNYPNPFNPTTMISYTLPTDSKVKIEIFNTLGQSVAVLVNDNKTAGYYESSWDASNLPSGIYLISIRAEGLDSKSNFSQVKKALLLK